MIQALPIPRPAFVIPRQFRGLGVTTSAVVTGAASSGAVTGFAAAMSGQKPLRAAGMAAGATIAALSPLAGPFAPIVAAFGGLVQVFSGMFHGCGQTCIDASNLANDANRAWKQISDQFFAMPVRYESDRQAALNAMDYVWQQLKGACDQPGLAEAGQRCWRERCCGCDPWDWCKMYRDQVATAPDVLPDPTPVESALATLGLPATDKDLVLGIAGLGMIGLAVMLL